MARLAVLFACVAAAVALFYAESRSPDPEPADASVLTFSAGRAMADIRAIAPVPHPTASPANAAVRDYLLKRMTALGLAPQVQRSESHQAQDLEGRPYVFGATVENVIGLLPGRDRALPALALMAHYDSVPGSPGAADDAAGVASALEILRAIKARGTPRRDVMLVITDGEEAGLLGARAFFGEHPLADRVGFVVNLEARGGGGRAFMFQTGAQNAGAVDLFRRTARRPQSNSLTLLVYRLMPNDTDFTVSDARHIPGLNLAFLGRQFDYHSPSSTIAALDQGALQSLGEQAMGPALAVAFSPTLPRPGPDLVYGNVIGGVTAAYPAWGGWVLLVIAAGLAALGELRAGRSRSLAWRDLWRGLGGGVLLLIGGMVAMELTRRVTGVPSGWMGYRPLLARFPLFEAAMGLTALGIAMMVPAAMARGQMRLFGAAFFLVSGLVILALTHGANLPIILGLAALSALLALAVFGKDASLCGSWTGLLMTGLGAALALQIAAPTAALAVGWPLMAGAALSALTAAGCDRRPALMIVVAAVTIAALAWEGLLLHTALQGLDMPALAALAIWTSAMVAWPLLWPAAPGSRLAFAAPAAMIGLGLGIALFLHFTSPWNARHPKADVALFAVDHDSGKAWRVATQAPDDAWLRGVLTADGGAVGRRTLPTLDDPVYAAPARPTITPTPAVTVESAPDGARTLRFTPADHSTDLALDLRSNSPVGQTRVNGRPTQILAKPGQWTHIIWRGGDPITVAFKPAGSGRLDIRYADYLDHWPRDARPLPPMPATVMGFDLAGSTVVVGEQASHW